MFVKFQGENINLNMMIKSYYMERKISKKESQYYFYILFRDGIKLERICDTEESVKHIESELEKLLQEFNSIKYPIR